VTAATQTVAAYKEDGPEGYIQRMLADATLPRLLIRGAECMLLSKVDFARPMLDVGSGDGSFAEALFAEPIDVGLDPWRQQMTYSRRLNAYHHLVQAAGNPMPFKDGAFASILSNSTLEHTQDPWAILQEMHRVARPGATCVITVPTPAFQEYLLGTSLPRLFGISSISDLYRRFFDRVVRHVHTQPAEVWTKWMREAGFEVSRTRPYFSRRQTQLLELVHYLSVPSILTHAALGRWVLLPGKEKVLPYAKMLSHYAEPGTDKEGAFVLIEAKKL